MMENNIPPPQKTSQAQPIGLDVLKNVKFADGKLTVGGKTYIVEYFPKGINSGEKANLTTEQLTKIGNLALKILEQSVPQDKKILLDGITINQKEINLPKVETKTETETEDKSEIESPSNSFKVAETSNDIFQKIYDIIKNVPKQPSPFTPKTEKKGVEDKKEKSPVTEKKSKEEYQSPKVIEIKKRSIGVNYLENSLSNTKQLDLEKYKDISLIDTVPQTEEEERELLKFVMEQSAKETTNSPKEFSINEKSYRTAGVPGDGNCMFHAIAKFSKEDQQTVRNKLADFIEKELPDNKQKFTTLIGGLIGLTIPQDQVLSKTNDYDDKDVKRACSTYAEELKKDQTSRITGEIWEGEKNAGVKRSGNSLKGWGGEEEYQIAAYVYNRPVYVWNKGSLERYAKDKNENIKEQFDSEKDKAIILYYNGSNHYDALLPVVDIVDIKEPLNKLETKKKQFLETFDDSFASQTSPKEKCMRLRTKLELGRQLITEEGFKLKVRDGFIQTKGDNKHSTGMMGNFNDAYYTFQSLQDQNVYYDEELENEKTSLKYGLSKDFFEDAKIMDQTNILQVNGQYFVGVPYTVNGNHEVLVVYNPTEKAYVLIDNMNDALDEKAQQYEVMRDVKNIKDIDNFINKKYSDSIQGSYLSVKQEGNEAAAPVK